MATQHENDVFDPEDPKVWEQADEELAAAKEVRARDPWVAHPGIQMASNIFVWTVLAILFVFIAYKLYERFAK